MRITKISTAMLRSLFFLGMSSVLGCGSSEINSTACKNGECSDPLRPFCDVDGLYPASQGIENTCIAQPDRIYCSETENTCVDGTFSQCVDGEFPVESSCLHGCTEAGTRCRNVIPSNNLQAYMDMAFLGPDVDVSGDLIIDTDADQITESGVVISDIPTFLVPPQNNGGVAIMVLVVKSWSSGDVELRGEAAVAIISYGDVTFRESIEVGRAGNWDDASCAPVWAPDDCTHNGQSAGGQGNRGEGGEGSAGNSGSPVHGTNSLEPLRGGCGSSSGGALQVTSNTSVEVIGQIRAMGFGGQSSDGCGGGYIGHASGGGAGGAVLLEAPSITLFNGISANGGSGACFGSDGQRGYFEVTSVTGPNCGVDGGRAGEGGAVSTDGGNGQTSGGSAVGSGGGAAGRIRINVLNGDFSTLPSTILSPAQVIGTIAVESP